MIGCTDEGVQHGLYLNV